MNIELTDLSNVCMQTTDISPLSSDTVDGFESCMHSWTACTIILYCIPLTVQILYTVETTLPAMDQLIIKFCRIHLLMGLEHALMNMGHRSM